MPSCIHCAGRGEVHDGTVNAWEPCPARCEAWRRVADEDAALESMETAYVPEGEECDGGHNAMQAAHMDALVHRHR